MHLAVPDGGVLSSAIIQLRSRLPRHQQCSCHVVRLHGSNVAVGCGVESRGADRQGFAATPFATLGTTRL